tara:strand:- start:901 stop:1773 length:873 start_codon:yes stop_codon:yes gene_type:complete
MATLGQKPATQHVSFQKQTITGNGGTSYTLQQSVGSGLDIAVFINNTRQEPVTAYSASGTALVMTGAVNASDNFYVLFLTKAIATTSLPVDVVGTTNIAADAVTQAKIAAGAIGTTELAGSIPDSKIAAMATSKLTGDIPYANMPAGSVIQVQYHVHQGQETYSISSTSGGAYSNVQDIITPRFASSKILVIISLDGVTWTSDGTYGHFRVKRSVGGTPTQIGTFGYPRQWNSVDNSSGVTMSSILYDSPNTTSAITYLFDFYSNSGTSNFNINRDNNGDSSITLMEIKQ